MLFFYQFLILLGQTINFGTCRFAFWISTKPVMCSTSITCNFGRNIVVFLLWSNPLL